MGTSKVTVNLVNGVPATDQNGAVTLDKNNDLKVKVGTGFAGTAKVSAFALYEWDSGKGNGQGNLLGTWTRGSSGTQPSTDVKIDKDGKDIRITDVDTVADTRYCYTATIHDDNGDHTTPDPELIVKKKKS